MSWTYSGDPSGSDRDEVRFLVGDTDTSDQQLSDEEIAYLLTEYTNPRVAAVAAVKAIIAKYARLVTKEVGDLRLQYSDRLANYKNLLVTLEKETAFSTVVPYAGGISKSDKDSVRDDSDRVKPSFAIDMHERYSPDEEEIVT